MCGEIPLSGRCSTVRCESLFRQPDPAHTQEGCCPMLAVPVLEACPFGCLACGRNVLRMILCALAFG